MSVRRAVASLGAAAVGCGLPTAGVPGPDDGGPPDAPDDLAVFDLGAGDDAAAPPDAPADGDGDAACPPGTKRCGTCVPLDDPAHGCASSGCFPCALANAKVACSKGACAIAECLPGFTNCNGVALDGCEANLSASPANCGACGNACSFPHAATTCVTGVCVAGACDPGFSNCDAVAANGCEANTASDPASCGGCGVVCPATPPAPPVCKAGVCGTSSCPAAKGDCDGDSKNGCEADLSSDPKHCGFCGNACVFANGQGACTAGVCKLSACNVPWESCDGVPDNGCETNTSVSILHCGACNTPCTAPANAASTCASGTCSWACVPGFADCNGDPTDGCEAAIAKDPAHCGACGLACALPHATQACAGGKCAIAGCDGGWANCDQIAANGCEVSLAADPKNCGGCGKSCGNGACTGGVCQPLVLAAGQKEPSGIALDDAWAYWADHGDGAIVRAAKDGSAIAIVSVDIKGPHGIAVDATHVYWTNPDAGRVLRAPKTGGSPEAIAVSQPSPNGIAVDAAEAFWTCLGGGGTVRKALKTGGPVVTLFAAAGTSHGIAVDGLYAFFAYRPGLVVRVPKTGGGTYVPLASGLGDPEDVATDAASVYFTTEGTGTVAKVPKAGGAAAVLAGGQVGAAGIATDGTTVYWTVPKSGYVAKVPAAGGVAAGIATGQGAPAGIAVDATWVFFTNEQGGTVVRLSK